MAEKEFKDVYWVCVKERTPGGLRHELERYTYESAAGALKKFEELVLDLEGRPTDKMLLVEVLFISSGMFSTIRERHLWEWYYGHSRWSKII